MSKKVEISKDGYSDLLNQVLTNLTEERNLALDRYRIQDEQIETMEDFVLQGKDVVAFLKLASERTNALFAISKEIKDITYANEINQSTVNMKTSDDDRKRLEEIARNLKASKKTIQDIKDEPESTEESPE